MTNEEIRRLVQKLYAWAEKRESINASRKSKYPLENELIHKSIRCIEFLRESRGETK